MKIYWMSVKEKENTFFGIKKNKMWIGLPKKATADNCN